MLLQTARGPDWRTQHDMLFLVSQAFPWQRGPDGAHETRSQRRRRCRLGRNVVHDR